MDSINQFLCVIKMDVSQMIYQCYAKNKHKKNLFSSSVYEPFGLEPGVNAKLFENCQELKDPFSRMQLTEYACFLWHWRNKANPDAWFGTTSHNQLKKFETVFKNKSQVTELCVKHEVLGWGRYLMLDARRNPISLKDHTDICHPGLSQYIEEVFQRFGHRVPDLWRTSPVGFFANYWVMKNCLFEDFMQFSWPMVKWSLENIVTTEYYESQHVYGTVSNAKATGYFMEKLFILWYMMRRIEPLGVGAGQSHE